jgi:hypothetical protein
MGLSPSCGLPAFTNMVLSLKEGVERYPWMLLVLF